MSGEYYGAEKSVPKFYNNNDYEIASPNPKKESYEAPGPDNRLNDIEEQLEMAEDRCNTLKGQLDYMKQIYGTKKKTRKISSAQPNGVKVSDDETFNYSTSSVSLTPPDTQTRDMPKRQNSNAVGTDNTGAAVRTINNILTGITASVNRLSELHVQLNDSPRKGKGADSKLSPVKGAATETMSQQEQKEFEAEAENICLINNGSNTILPIQPKLLKKRLKEQRGLKKHASNQTIKKSVKVDRRVNNVTYQKPLFPTTNKILPSMKAKAKLVEIFNNKESKSSESDEFQRNQQHAHGDHTQVAEISSKGTDIPILEFPNEAYQENVTSQCHSRRMCQNLGEEEEYYPAIKEKSDACNKSYELPTIASRMKQAMVCKLVEGKSNEKMSIPKKAIPFCAAISTSPSHNIGINIQQVMNILKNRQPVNGISPTLAHNIGLAAERLNSKPLSTLVSSINSNVCYVKPQQCPLSKCKLNYQYLQDLAKSIPEETYEEVEGEEQQEMNTMIITGPSGDTEVKSKNVPQWAVEKCHGNVCTCIQNTGPDLNYICTKISKKSANVISSQTSMLQRTKEPPNKWNLKNDKRPQSVQPMMCRPSTADNPFEGKEKNLKLVLTHLHDEFDAMNKKYEELSKKAVGMENEETTKELENMETELTKKEEEITMVMTLCKEVMALKQQIKCLKQNSSQCSFPQERKESTSTNFNDFNNPQAAFHLTKLLKQIQTYQMKYKNGVGI